MSSQAFFYKVWFGSYGQDAHISLSSTAHDRTPFCAHPECLIIVMVLPIRFIGVYRTLSRSERLLKNTKNHEKTRRWMVGGGRWTVDGGRWTVDCGRWAVDGGRWSGVSMVPGGLAGSRATVDGVNTKQGVGIKSNDRWL